MKKSNVITIAITLFAIIIGSFILIVFTNSLLKPKEAVKWVEQEQVKSESVKMPFSEIELYPCSALNTEILTSLTNDDVQLFRSKGLEKQIRKMLLVFCDDALLQETNFTEKFTVLHQKDEPKEKKQYVLKDFLVNENQFLNCIVSLNGQIKSFYVCNKGSANLQSCYEIVQKQLNNQLSDENIKRLAALKATSDNFSQPEIFSITKKFPDYITSSPYSLYSVDNMIAVKYQITDSTLFFMLIDAATSNVCGFHIQRY